MAAKQSAEMKKALKLHAEGMSVAHAAQISGVRRESLHAAIKKQKVLAESKKIVQNEVIEVQQQKGKDDD